MAVRLFGRREAREETIDATEAAVARMEAAAAGKDARPEALAVLEIAAGFVGRAFASAAVEGPEAARLLSREALALIGRSLVLRGELVMVPEDGALIPASTFDIRGGPRAWTYRADFAGPSRQVSRFLQADNLLHFRVNVDPSQPWKGRAAHSIATATATTAANAEAGAGQEAKIAVSRLVPVASPTTPDQRDQSTSTFAQDLVKGGIFAISLVGFRPGLGERMNRANVEKVHPDPSEGHLRLRRSAALELLEAAGVPSALADPAAEANGQREAFRRFVHATIEPMARVVEAEFKSKTALDCSLDFARLFAADLAGRTRGLKQLVESGMGLDEALVVVGLGGDA